METKKLSEENRRIIVEELLANEKNYQTAVDSLADVSMWVMDGSITIDDEMRDTVLQTLAKARGQFKFIVQLLNPEIL